jgi:hypothetical protein
METKTPVTSQLTIVVRDARGHIVLDETYRAPAGLGLPPKAWAR